MTDAPRPIDDATLARLRHGGDDHRDRLAGMAAADPDLRGRMAEWDRQDAAIRALYGPVGEEPVPARHRAVLAAHRPRWPGALARLAAAIALVALGGLGGWTAARWSGPPAGSLVAEALRTHATFAVEVAHPVEVPASDEAHLVRWLSNRLGHKITPPDLSGQGFHLIGGRIVPDSRGTAAVLMYEDDIGRRVTLFVARSPGMGETEFRAAGDGDTQAFWWVDGDLGCALVGDLPLDTLRALSVAAYHGLTAT